MRDGATRLHDTGGRAGIGYGRMVLGVAAMVREELATPETCLLHHDPGSDASHVP